MAKPDYRDTIVSCLKPQAICRVLFRNRSYDELLFPLRLSDKLFLSVIDQDFQLDGYTVRRLRDIVLAEPVRGNYLRMHKAEGNLSRLHVPPVPLRDWREVCDTLAAANELIMLECDAENDELTLLCGKITAVALPAIRFLPFDGDGEWHTRPITILYRQIRAITFGSRYLTTYAKYLPRSPR